MLRKLLLLVALPAVAQPPQSVESFLREVNRALRADAADVAALFTPDAEYRIGTRTVATGPADIAEQFIPPPFREQTRPALENEVILPLSPGFTLVTAHVVSYGSVFLKQKRPVLLFLMDTGAGWRIVSWSTAAVPSRAAARSLCFLGARA